MKDAIKSGVILIMIAIFVFSLSACGDKKSSNDLEGTWVLTSDDSRQIEFTKDKIRFNYFVYAYETDGNTINFKQTHPTSGHSGKMTYSIKDDVLTLDLEDMDGYLYGHKGRIKLERFKLSR